MNDSKSKCSECGNTFTQKKNLYTHYRKIHQIEPLESKPEHKFQCSLCDKTFSCQSSLSKHTRQIHTAYNEHNYSSSGSTRRIRLVCPHDTCSEEFVSYVNLYKHLSEEHSIEVQYEDLSFNSMQDFEQWKNQIQQKTLCSYTQDTAMKHLKTGVNRIYFNCHRSYCYKSKGKHIRAIKSIGTNKIGKACPSRLEVTLTENGGELIVSVRFLKTHYGHTEQIGRIALSKDIRLKIAGKLKEGVSFNRVLDSIRDSELSDYVPQRLLLLDRKDMHNIVRDFNINYPTRRHQNDAISVKLWVEEMNKLGEDSPVLYYKGQNEKSQDLDTDDFALVLMTNFQAQQLTQFGRNKICIDGTHGTNGYDFQLYTLLTVDEFGSGCPVAFCFSNRSNENLFRVYFNAVKSKVGIISAEVFMSDDAPAFYNAWTNVMGSVSHKLLCTWHIDKNWRQNLNKINGNSEKKALVYKTLRVLLQLTSVDDFERCLEQVLKDLLDDVDTKSFGEYFQNHYYNRPKSWAYCYRLGLGINTNMYLESLHKILKYIYLEGKRVKRLDKSINAVMKLARDSFFKRLIKLSKKTPTEKIKKINQSHVASNSIKLEDIQVIEEQKEWIITSSSNPIQKYQVVKAQETCDILCLTCKQCNICIHTFKCSCIDNLIKINICKHIHACAREFYMIPTFTSTSTNKDMEMDSNQIVDLMEMKRFNVDINTTNNENLVNKTELLLGLFNVVSLSDADNLAIEKQIDRLIESVNKAKLLNLDTKEVVNVNKKIEKQVRLCQGKKKSAKYAEPVDNESFLRKEYENIRFYSTKKGHQKAGLKKPSMNESIAIVSGLCNENGEAINIHQSSDHSYI